MNLTIGQKRCQKYPHKELKNYLLDRFLIWIGKDWYWNDSNKKVFNNWVKYLNNDKSCDWNLDRSIILSGNNGSGKTTLLRWFSFVSVSSGCEFDMDKRFTNVYSEDLVDGVLTTGMEYLISHYNRTETYSLGIDEVGAEQECKVFGNVVYPVEKVISSRHNQGLLTFMTTNLKEERFEAKYGKRLQSRVKEMNFVKLISPKDYRGL